MDSSSPRSSRPDEAAAQHQCMPSRPASRAARFSPVPRILPAGRTRRARSRRASRRSHPGDVSRVRSATTGSSSRSASAAPAFLSPGLRQPPWPPGRSWHGGNHNLSALGGVSEPAADMERMEAQPPPGQIAQHHVTARSRPAPGHLPDGLQRPSATRGLPGWRPVLGARCLYQPAFAVGAIARQSELIPLSRLCSTGETGAEAGPSRSIRPTYERDRLRAFCGCGGYKQGEVVSADATGFLGHRLGWYRAMDGRWGADDGGRACGRHRVAGTLAAGMASRPGRPRA